MSGALAIPTNLVAAATAGGLSQPLANIDTNLAVIAAYVNAREITIDVLANRPGPGAGGTSHSLFLATDVNGGTLYVDTGAAWVQASAGSSQTAASVGLIASLPTPVPFR